MEELNGMKLKEVWTSRQFQFVEELKEKEIHPMPHSIRLYKGLRKLNYLFLRVELEEVDRWMIVGVDEETLQSYLNGNKNLSEIFRDEENLELCSPVLFLDETPLLDCIVYERTLLDLKNVPTKYLELYDI